MLDSVDVETTAETPPGQDRNRRQVKSQRLSWWREKAILMQIVKILTLLVITIAPIVGLRLAWKWAEKSGRQFNERHPRYQRRRPDEPDASLDRFHGCRTYARSDEAAGAPAGLNTGMHPTCHIDHITVVAPSLAAGDAWVHRHLGVHPQRGGEHPRMGTHNLLLPLGEMMFLEVIAIDPAAPPPARPRWFALDHLLPDSEPRLGCWVARSDDLDASLAHASEDLGLVEPMSRGALDWHITIPADGSLPLGGVAPALIRWATDPHPARGMDDRGCRLVELRLLHPQAQRLAALVGSLRFAGSGPLLSWGEAPAPALVARIETPSGLRTIGPDAPQIAAPWPPADVGS